MYIHYTTYIRHSTSLNTHIASNILSSNHRATEMSGETPRLKSASQPCSADLDCKQRHARKPIQLTSSCIPSPAAWFTYLGININNDRGSESSSAVGNSIFLMHLLNVASLPSSISYWTVYLQSTFVSTTDLLMVQAVSVDRIHVYI